MICSISDLLPAVIFAVLGDDCLDGSDCYFDDGSVRLIRGELLQPESGLSKAVPELAVVVTADEAEDLIGDTADERDKDQSQISGMQTSRIRMFTSMLCAPVKMPMIV